MSAEFHRAQFAAAQGRQRKVYTKPVLEVLRPGTERYEAAKAALAK